MAEIEFKNNEKRIHDSLMKAKGSYRKAARSLGVTPTTLKTYIYASENLKALWVNKTKAELPCNGTFEQDIDITGTIMGRDPILPDLDDADFRISLALDKEESEFAQRLEKLNISPERVQFMVNVTKLHAKHSAMSIDLINGSLTVVVERLTNRIEKLSIAIDDSTPNDEPSIILYKARLDAFISCVDSLAAISKHAMDNVLTKAKVAEAMAKLRNMKNNPDNLRSAKPGFTPLQKPVEVKAEKVTEAVNGEALHPEGETEVEEPETVKSEETVTA